LQQLLTITSLKRYMVMSSTVCLKKNIIIQECNSNAIQRKINAVIEMHKNTKTCQIRQIKLSFTSFSHKLPKQ